MLFMLICALAMMIDDLPYTVESLLKDTLNKGHNTFYLSVKDKFCGPYSIMAIQFYLLKRTTSL